MTLNDVINKFDAETILGRLVELYPEQANSREGYAKVLEGLRRLKPESNGRLAIDIRRVEDDGEKYVAASGFLAGEKCYYVISFEPWQHWLGMPICDHSLKDFSELDIICHCLWEMTWDGFDQEAIQAKSREIFGKLSSIQEEIDGELQTQEM